MENLKDESPGDLHSASGTVYTRSSGGPIPARHEDPATEYTALKDGAVLVDRSERTVLRLSGRDPVGMLDAILTNEVPREPNIGTYAALLNPKGRIQTDLRIIRADGSVLVDTEPEGAAAAREILGRYAPFSRVELEDLSASGSWGILGLYGPRARELLNDLRLAEHESVEIEVGGANLLATGVAVPVSGFDLLGSADSLRAAREHLIEAGAVPACLDAYETARIEVGIPRFGSDITPKNFPAEVGILERAVSFGKGCYPGQETVARMYYRGHPNRTLYRLVVEGPLPAPETPIIQNEKQVGRITSIAPLPVDGRYLALGYLSRNTDLDGPLQAGDATVSPVGAGKGA
jgi:folate-binding protein YgfZ